MAVRTQMPVPTLGQLLEQSDLFGVVAAAERDLLIPHFRSHSLHRGETLIREGEMPDAMFLIASGAAEITTATPLGPRVVHRTSPGESLGAIGLITNTPYTATATALTALQAYRLAKPDIAAAIKARPELTVALEELARRGQDALRRDVTATEQAEPIHPEMLLSRLRSFLHVLAA